METQDKFKPIIVSNKFPQIQDRNEIIESKVWWSVFNAEGKYEKCISYLEYLNTKQK